MSQLLEQARGPRKPMVGMIQLGPLAGGSRHCGTGIGPLIDAAVEDAILLKRNGFDAVMVQNLGDLPVDLAVAMPQVAWMTRIVAEVARAAAGLPVGLNFLENDAEAMLAVASAAPVDFIRIKIFVGAMVTPAGIEGGQAFKAQRARRLWGATDTAIFADVHDRTGVPLASGGLAEDIHHAVALGGAEGIVLTGRSWNETQAFIDIGQRAGHGVPILVGGSVDAANVADVLRLADGAVVSSSLKASNSPFGRLNAERVAQFMAAVVEGRDAMT
jgi:membrane complex biogenesis BtpA family protein